MSKSVTGPNRAIAAAGVLVAVWIVVWWMTPVRPEPGLSFAHEAAPVLTRMDSIPVEPKPEGPRTDWTEPPATPAKEVRTPTTTQAPAKTLSTDGAPSTRPYTVRSGDTFQTIARATLGDSSKWSIIARTNPRVDPIRLRAGMILQIPNDPSNLQGAPAEPVPAATTSSKPTANTGSDYLVQSGDTLSGIAKQTLGSSARWPEILEANSTLLKSPRDLRPGMRLNIPGR